LLQCSCCKGGGYDNGWQTNNEIGKTEVIGFTDMERFDEKQLN
jgi:hypothetical protein